MKNITVQVGTFSFEMVAIEGGTFEMGGTPEQGTDVMDDELPVHPVTVANYFLGKYVVTKALWKEVMGPNHCFWRDSLEKAMEPAENVSWSDANQFIEKLNERTALCFSLPTEAQWEFAARGGTKSRGYKYAGGNDLDTLAWYDKNSNGQVHAVGKKEPNELGLYDMSGNVWEWCYDELESYEGNPDPWVIDSEGTKHRVLRGGSYLFIARYCRNSCRYDFVPYDSHNCIGFRLALMR